MENKKMFSNPSLKWIGLMPGIAMILLLAALVFALLVPTSPYTSYDTNFTVVLIVGLIIISILTVALIGVIRESKGMFLIGSAITLWASDIAFINILSRAIGYNANNKIVALGISFLVVTCIVSVALGIAGIITGLQRKQSYTFLMITSLLAEIFLFGFSVVTIVSLGIKNANVFEIIFAILFELALLIIVGSMLYIAIVGIKEEKSEAAKLVKAEEEKAKSLKETEQLELIKKFKTLLDDGAITKAEFEKKKKEIIG